MVFRFGFSKSLLRSHRVGGFGGGEWGKYGPFLSTEWV